MGSIKAICNVHYGFGIHNGCSVLQNGGQEQNDPFRDLFYELRDVYVNIYLAYT